MMARIDNETIRYLFHIRCSKATSRREGDSLSRNRRARRRKAPLPPLQAPRRVRASRQQLPSVAREIERRQHGQQKDLQYQTGACASRSAEACSRGRESGSQRSLSLRIGEEYKKCHGA